MANNTTSDELAQLRILVAAQQGRLARLERPRRHMRRILPLALVALLVALLPLATFAAGFTDLNPGSPHNDNIAAIAAVGITRGCNPPDYTQYCPDGKVTREEMASFLARTAGLGTNPPVVNAKTAQTATSATNATNATNATHAGSADTATNATNATNAGNANTVGGYAPNGLVRVALNSTEDLFSGTTKEWGMLQITAPAPGFVLITGTIVAYGNSMCPCNALVKLRHVQSGLESNSSSSTVSPGNLQALPITWVFAVNAGAQTFVLRTGSFNANGFYNPILTALYVPFGATGTTP